MHSATQPETTVHNSKSGQEVAKHDTPKRGTKAKRSLARTHQDYWKSRLERRCYTREGQLLEVNEWSVRIQHLGRRKSFALNTTNKETAAAQARDIYLAVVARGWDAAEREFAPEMLVQKDAPTVGDFLAEIQAKSGLKPKTFNNYCVCFRKIASDVFGIVGDERKYDYRGGGRMQWLEQVHAVKLHALTPNKVQAWKVAYIAKAGSDPVALTKAKRNVNTLIRCSKALFSRRMTKFLNIALPSSLPFDGIEFEKEGSKRYKSNFNHRSLITAAKRELSVPSPDNPERPELYKIFLLAIGAGLRKAEIDTLCWSQIDWKRASIWIGPTPFFAPKSADSQGSVDVDRALLDELRRYMQGSQGEFVINSKLPARPGCGHTYYRADNHFEALNDWLRSKGVSDRKPLHALRKEFGSLICREAGLYAASSALRHASVQVSAAHYIDKKQRVTIKLRQLLRAPRIRAADRNQLPAVG